MLGVDQELTLIEGWGKTITMTRLLDKVSENLRFHFLADRETNNVEFPQWMFEYMIDCWQKNLSHFHQQLGVERALLEDLIVRQIHEFSRGLILERLRLDLPLLAASKELTFIFFRELYVYENCWRMMLRETYSVELLSPTIFQHVLL